MAPGQTLSGIAVSYGTTVTALVGANGITNPNDIVAGTVLQLPTLQAPTSVTVAGGDTLSAIAAAHGLTPASIATANHLANPNAIYVGEVLQLPVSGGGHTGAVSHATPVTVVVAPGQTLSSIATRYGTTVAALASANAIANPNLVLSGLTLEVPSASVDTSTGGGGPWPATLQNYPGRLQYLPDFENAASTYGVPLSLLEGVCLWESGWQPTVVSVTGAIGMCQIEPYVAIFVDTVLEPGSHLLVHSVAGNIDMAAALLHDLLARTGGNRALAVAGYYQGLSSVMALGEYATTRVYVHGILALTTQFAAAG